MTGIKELPELMIELIDLVDPELKFPARAREIIREIADYGKGIKLGDEADALREAFEGRNADAAPRDIYMYMLERISGAPTVLHRDGSALLLMPMRHKAIEETQMCRVCGCTWDNGCAEGCGWAEDDLCTECSGEEGTA